MNTLLRLSGALRRVRQVRAVSLAAGLFSASLALPVLAVEAPAEAELSEPSQPAGAVYVDPLGFVVFGPTAGVELALGDASAVVYGRWFSAGMLSRSMFLDGQDSEFAFSHGVGAKGRYYLDGGLAGTWLGGGLEYLSTRIERPMALRVSLGSYVVPQAEVGYRQALGSFFISGAGALGYAYELSRSIEDLPGGNTAHRYYPLDESTFYGSASLELGMYF